MTPADLNYFGKNRIPCVFITDFEGKHWHIFSLAEAEKQGLRVQTPSQKATVGKAKNEPIEWRVFPPTLAQYSLAYQLAYDNLQFGNSYLLNLSAPSRIETNWTLAQIFQASQAKYKVYFDNQFVCFSPETFVQMRAGKIYSFPMKGTIDASLPDARQTILADEKELAEHYTIVDLIRNDLSQVADSVRVARFRYIDRLKTHTGKALLQVSSKVVGNLPADYHAHLGDILASLLPAGSISGAPKKKTVEIIKEAESVFNCGDLPYTRHFYTGICGYFDGENLDTGVMIRYVERVGEGLYFKSGGGITTQSTLESEYNELIQKIYVPIA
ncbi:MAG: aminodeoxychorismate synthase component I [Bacteroidetes bacterium]|nr:MAG: aminodeoxychorismate synthase component I [Bacteroidota bacterium]